MEAARAARAPVRRIVLLDIQITFVTHIREVYVMDILSMVRAREDHVQRQMEATMIVLVMDYPVTQKTVTHWTSHAGIIMMSQNTAMLREAV